MTALLIAIGGGLGALARWGIATMLPKGEHGFPVGITTVNVIGTFALGLIVGYEANGQIGFATDAVTIGILGGFTTFSTWMVDIDEGPTRAVRLATVVVPIVLGFAAGALGLAIGLS